MESFTVVVREYIVHQDGTETGKVLRPRGFTRDQALQHAWHYIQLPAKEEDGVVTSYAVKVLLPSGKVLLSYGATSHTW